MISVKKLYDFDLEDVPDGIPEDLALIPPKPRPSFIILTSHKEMYGQTIITGSVPSAIFYAIMIREGNFRGELRRSSKQDPYNFCTFVSLLCPFVLVQLLYLFGYRVVSLMFPPISAYGEHRKVWTLQSGFPFHRTKTYVAIMKYLANKGYNVESEGRLWGRPPPPWLEMLLATGEQHKRVVDYILLRSGHRLTSQGDLAGELFVEPSSAVRVVLRKKSEELNEFTREWEILWYTLKGRKELWDSVMVPFEATIPQRCVVPGMGESRNLLVYFTTEWYEASEEKIKYVKRLPEQAEIIAKAVGKILEESTFYQDYGKSILESSKRSYLGIAISTQEKAEHGKSQEETIHELPHKVQVDFDEDDEDDDDTEMLPEGAGHVDTGEHYMFSKPSKMHRLRKKDGKSHLGISRIPLQNSAEPPKSSMVTKEKGHFRLIRKRSSRSNSTGKLKEKSKIRYLFSPRKRRSSSTESKTSVSDIQESSKSSKGKVKSKSRKLSQKLRMFKKQLRSDKRTYSKPDLSTSQSPSVVTTDSSVSSSKKHNLIKRLLRRSNKKLENQQDTPTSSKTSSPDLSSLPSTKDSVGTPTSSTKKKRWGRRKKLQIIDSDKSGSIEKKVSESSIKTDNKPASQDSEQQERVSDKHKWALRHRWTNKRIQMTPHVGADDSKTSQTSDKTSQDEHIKDESSKTSSKPWLRKWSSRLKKKKTQQIESPKQQDSLGTMPESVSGSPPASNITRKQKRRWYRFQSTSKKSITSETTTGTSSNESIKPVPSSTTSPRNVRKVRWYRKFSSGSESNDSPKPVKATKGKMTFWKSGTSKRPPTNTSAKKDPNLHSSIIYENDESRKRILEMQKQVKQKMSKQKIDASTRKKVSDIIKSEYQRSPSMFNENIPVTPKKGKGRKTF